MKKIILDKAEKLAALQEELNRVQGRATARTLSAEDVKHILAEAEKKIDVPKKALAGTKVQYHNGQTFPAAYKYRAEGTQFDATHNGRCWVIESVTRYFVPNRQTNSCITLSETAKAAVLEKFDNIWLSR